MNEIQKRFLNREGYCRLGAGNIYLIKLLRKNHCYFILFPADKSGIKRSSKTYVSVDSAITSYANEPIKWV